MRQSIWRFYHQNLYQSFISRGWKIPAYPLNESEISGHIFYLIAPTIDQRNALLDYLSEHGIQSTFHYQPLHKSPAGIQFGRSKGNFPETEIASNCLLRLPIWPDLDQKDLEFIVEIMQSFLKNTKY